MHHNPVAAAERAVEWASRHDEMWVHVDIDVLSWVHFPVAENSRRRDGLTIDELATVLHLLLTASNWRGLTICEVNPDHAPDEAESFARLVTTMGEIFTVDDCGWIPSEHGERNHPGLPRARGCLPR